MKYIIQLHTGSLEKSDYMVDEIIHKLDYLLSKMNTTMVLMGWYKDPFYNKTLCDYLKSKNIKAILKLPVLSEITDSNQEDDFVYVNNKQNNNHFYKGDKFDFVCPSSDKNINYVLDLFKQMDKDVNFDGVFLDRIRYPAISINNSAILGCQCEQCKKLYENINMNNIDSYVIKQRTGFIYEYDHQDLNKLMKIKREIINTLILKLTKEFKKMGKIVGIDTFSPMLADLVGQDLASLSKMVDFIKPMNYLKTNAPAGIPYELDALPKDLKQSLMKCWKEDPLTIESSVEMCQELMKLNNRITIGIDANYVKDICNSDKEYIINHIKAIENVGIEEIVLSWNSMLIEDDVIEALHQFGE